MNSSKIKVEIFGNNYTIKGDTSPDYILMLADYVNQKMVEVNAAIHDTNPLHVAILAAMNIADEFHQLKRMNNGIEGAVEEKTRELISLLDEGLIGDILNKITSIEQ